MYSRSTKPTCLSSDRHEDNISNHLLHYLGCIELTERETFFDETNEVWENEIQHQLERSNSENSKTSRDEVYDQVHSKRKKWQKECHKDLRRFAFIRKCLEDPEKGEPHLVEAVNKSLRAWRNTPEYQKGIQDVKRWSNRPHYDHPDPNPIRDEDYHPNRDLNVHIIRYKDREEKSTEARTDRRGSEAGDISYADNWKEKMETETMKVHDVISKAKNGKDHRLNKLREGTEKEAISYVHFPANNMKWVEETPDYQGVLRELHSSGKTETYMILRPQYWRGQMHGSTSSLPHTRHMRPVCESISSHPDLVSSNPKNMVLFMPYLHWEKDRCRHKFATAMQEIRESWEAKRLQGEMSRKKKRQKTRSGLHTDKTKLRPPMTKAKSDASKLARLDDVVERVHPSRVILPKGCSPLGQFLLHVAALYEAMSHFRDKQLLKEYLYEDPPIHPRRTLDQAYYWTMNTTQHRDRDQVIYRATNASPRDFRHLDHEGEEWVDHSKETTKDECESCTKAIRKISRAVMVDQLWMWILEGKTIITCFPKRYGTQKHDRSGVHKSIRTRLENARPNQIKSVFDLALIIIDECSNTFFDRAETADLQPRVIDKFSEAIGDIARKETTSFERLVLWTKKARAFYRHPRNSDPNELHVPLLDINPEANMHREIKDIIEELDIMIYVVRSHMRVLEDFITHVQHMLDPEGIFSYKNMPRGYYPSRMIGQPPSRVGTNDDKQKHTYKFFMLNAEEMRIKMDSRIMELEQLRQSAQSVCDSVKNLMDMKQQQAGVVQAWMALNQTEESVNQGRSIMLFTVVTIIFLPLTFTAGIFGMNAIEFGADGSFTIAKEFAVMFPISLFIIAVTLTFAFSLRIRTMLWALWQKYEKTNALGESAIKTADEIVRLRKVEKLRKLAEERIKDQECEHGCMSNGVDSGSGHVNGGQRGTSHTSERAGQEDWGKRFGWLRLRRSAASKNGVDDGSESGAV
ncbi:hypothetical protein FSARC_13450 [Fusarium sarcochroum]|uniref:Uncharacterized protein n=1 Tax=Fusarium sarcochroum TaxID=1208366 RepID=A0A8H4T1G1_9HYPO|nr:hypothetical protein FSARC_13450 [Fusarium sarcochroum]